MLRVDYEIVDIHLSNKYGRFMTKVYQIKNQ